MTLVSQTPFGTHSRGRLGSRPRPGLSRHGLHGFTLIELLVVISIITLLIAILLPVIGSARETARQIACASNNRQMAMATLVLANDQNQRTPIAGRYFASMLDNREQMRDLETYLESGTPRPFAYPAAIAPYMGDQIRRDNRTLMRIDLADPRRMTGMLCPSEDRFTPAMHLSNRLGSLSGWTAPMSITHYGFNENLMGSSLPGFTQTRAEGFLQRVAQTSRVVLYADAQPREAVGGTTADWNGYSAGNPESTLLDAYALNSTTFDPLRHEGVMTVTYVDGHAESLRIDDDAQLSRGGLRRGLSINP